MDVNLADATRPMDRSDLLQEVLHGTTRVRLAAARELARVATADDVDVLESARAAEHDAYVRTALDRAIGVARGLAALEDATTPGDIPVSPGDELIRNPRLVEHLTKRFVHELRPLIGLVRLDARDDLNDYESSATKKALDALAEALRALDTLGRASRISQVEDFDCAGLLMDIADGELTRLSEQVQEAAESLTVEFAGPTPAIFRGDRALVDLACRNGVRNAFEASLVATGTGGGTRIVISWDTTDREHWVSVLDSGRGLPTGRPIYEFGESTKRGHLGVGLTIARQAAATMGGHLIIVPREPAGVRFELRWPVLPGGSA